MGANQLWKPIGLAGKIEITDFCCSDHLFILYSRGWAMAVGGMKVSASSACTLYISKRCQRLTWPELKIISVISAPNARFVVSATINPHHKNSHIGIHVLPQINK